jgi:hypothetical protein
MSGQVRNHGKVVASFVTAIGLDAAQRLLESALYFVAIGSNDFIGNYVKQGSPDAKAYTPTQFVALLANSLTAQIMVCTSIVFDFVGSLPDKLIKRRICTKMRSSIGAFSRKQSLCITRNRTKRLRIYN